MIKHKTDCKMVFGRKDPSCPRCQELLSGAKPREGWQREYYTTKQQEEARWARALKQHNCQESKCMPICTAFDW